MELSENLKNYVYMKESPQTEKEKEDAVRKEKLLKSLRNINASETTMNAIMAGCGVYIAGRYVQAIAQLNNNMKDLKAKMEKEKAKDEPDDQKIKQYEKDIKAIKASKVIISAFAGGAAAYAGNHIYKTSKGVKNDSKLKDAQKTAKAEQKVVVTYDKNGVKEESVETTESVKKTDITFEYNKRKYIVYKNSSELDDEFLEANKLKIIANCISILKREPAIIKKLTTMYKITGNDLEKSHIDGFEVVSSDTYKIKNSTGFLIGIFESPNQIGCVFNGTTMIDKSICIY